MEIFQIIIGSFLKVLPLSLSYFSPSYPVPILPLYYIPTHPDLDRDPVTVSYLKQRPSSL